MLRAGAAKIAQLQKKAGDRIRIMAGGGIRVSNVHSLALKTGVREVHTSLSRDVVAKPSDGGAEIGAYSTGHRIFRVLKQDVQAFKSALDPLTIESESGLTHTVGPVLAAVSNLGASTFMSSKTDKRAKEILRLLLNQGRASVDELTSALGTSPASIRRDLIRLESNGLVTRTHGGAMLSANGSPVYEPFRFDASFQIREDRFASEKQRIARAAAALIQENETIGFAAGTTTTLVARHLLHRRNIQSLPMP